MCFIKLIFFDKVLKSKEGNRVRADNVHLSYNLVISVAEHNENGLPLREFLVFVGQVDMEGH